MKILFTIPVVITLVLLSACGSRPSACPEPTGGPHYLALPPEALPTPAPAGTPVPMRIGGKSVSVDKVVEGPLCNDDWRGTIYVTCNVQVYPWQDSPTFLKDCNLSIAPGSVVYVADHNDTAYYNGCSCHTGKVAGQ